MTIWLKHYIRDYVTKCKFLTYHIYFIHVFVFYGSFSNPFFFYFFGGNLFCMPIVICLLFMLLLVGPKLVIKYYYYYQGWDHINWFNPATFLCLFLVRTWISKAIFFMFSELRLEVIVHFVDHHCLNFLFKIINYFFLVNTPYSFILNFYVNKC